MWYTYRAGMAGATWKCCYLGAFCVHHTTMHHVKVSWKIKSHIRKLYACLAVTCHLHFWQNDRGVLRATAVTRGWNGYRNKSQHRKLTMEKKILPPLLQGFEPRPFDHESGALTTELSSLPWGTSKKKKTMWFFASSLINHYRMRFMWTLSKLQELCESRDGRPSLPVPNVRTVSADVKQYWTWT